MMHCRVQACVNPPQLHPSSGSPAPTFCISCRVLAASMQAAAATPLQSRTASTTLSLTEYCTQVKRAYLSLLLQPAFTVMQLISVHMHVAHSHAAKSCPHACCRWGAFRFTAPTTPCSCSPACPR